MYWVYIIKSKKNDSLYKEDALLREKNLKYFGKVYAQLKRRIKNSLQGA